MIISTKLMRSMLNNLLNIPANRICRAAFLVLVQFILCGNIAIAQDISVLWEDTPTTSAIQISGATLYTALNEVIAFEGELDVDATYVNVYTSDDGLSVFKGGYENSFLTDGSKSLASGQYYNSILSCYSIPFSAFKAVFYTRDNPYGEPLVVQNSESNITKITFYSPPDDFYGTYSGSEPTVIPIVVATDATSKVVTFTIDTEKAKYARFVLMRNGVAHDISRTAITVSGGQSSEERPKRGVYIYSDGLGSSIDVTVTLDAGTYEDYQLVAYFSDEAPTLDGSTITKEPEILDEKQIYSFTYPVTTIDKYIAWNTNSTTLNITSFITEDLPTLTNSSTKGYISWALYNGPYGQTGTNPVQMTGNNWSNGWMIYKSEGTGSRSLNPYQDARNVFAIADAQLNVADNWSAFTKPELRNSTGNFDNFKNYVLVCELSDASSDKIRVRYIFHFNADGLPPYELVNETNIAADKKVIPITDYEAASGVLDVSDALVTGAKYARIYVAKYDNANAESANLTVTYDGAVITKCATGYEKYGWYLSEAGGIDVSKLSVTGLTADEMLKYNVIVVSSASPLSGDQEPVWEKKTVYSFQKDIKNRIMGDDESTKELNLSDILTRVGSAVSDLSKSLYVKWYVESPNGSRQQMDFGGGSWDEPWRVDVNSNNWLNDGTALTLYTGCNTNTTSTAIEQNYGNPDNGIFATQIAKAAQKVSVPNGGKFSSFFDYKIVFEFSDEYDTTSGTEPPYKLKYVWTIVDPNAFTGTLSDTGVEDETTMEVSRSTASVDLDLATKAFAHSKLTGTDKPKYVRFYLTDTNGNLMDPTGKLSVSYAGGDVTTCNTAEDGFYVYDGKTTELNLSNISVSLAAPKKYKLYNVVAVFSTAMTEVLPDDGAKPLTREPDWELKYTYSFTYPDPTTKEIAKTIEWRRNAMTAHASTIDPDVDWDSSWEELSLGQYVKWYVVDGSNVKQTLVAGDSRQSGAWAIDVADFTIDSNTAVLTGQSTFTSTHWNKWGKPAVYAPVGVEFEAVQDYKVICEIYTNDTGTGNPNARYTFSLYKSYLGELKDGGTTGSETIEVGNSSTSETVTLGNALIGFSGTAKYARVWLTTADGDLVDPTGKLTVSGMTAYQTEGNTDVCFGYYLTDEGGISTLSDATLTLNAGAYEQYQVHVALSEGTPSTIAEPDYDRVYTFGFKYPIKTKYKTLLYDADNKTCTPHLLEHWQEVAVDCNEGRTNLADKLYVRWYLEDKNGNPLTITDFSSTAAYNSLSGTNGYYFDDFTTNGFADRGTGTDYNPTIKLPDGVNYKDVRVVCVVTTKTDGYTPSPWTKDPDEMQAKYVYSLYTQTELENLPFIHYQGEGYRYLKDNGFDSMAATRDYITASGSAGISEYSWNLTGGGYTSKTENIRQNVHTVDYYYYLNLADGETEKLNLPLQYYSGGGNDTEPRAYFRWYDYPTDKKSVCLSPAGTSSLLVEKEYGLVALPFGADPNYGNIGVDFTAPTGFTSLTAANEITIACDVSRYLDGMDDSFTYLVHEPTLSERFIFHILPASILAANTKSKAESLAAVETQIQTKSPTATPSILEYSGRNVISLTEAGAGEFSMRSKIRMLEHYYVYNGSNVVAANNMQWYAYAQDDDGNWWKHTIDMGGRSSVRQAKYTLSDFGGTWTRLSGSGGTAPTIGVAKGNQNKVVMIATISNTNYSDTELPFMWTELEFIAAPPLALGSEIDERTDAYMKREYRHAKTLDFNDFFMTGLKTPENSFENYTKIPLEFVDAQYGFCYPQLYGLCATNRLAGWGEYGISPLHGDYTLLKSMNMQGISKDVDRDNQSIFCQWWSAAELFDVTHERVSGKGTSDTNDYGAFLYVDAADEARTIAVLEFDASLCSNSRIYYTAYVSDMTDGATKPMLRFRVTTDDEHGNRVPVVSFVTGGLDTEVSLLQGQWYQVYGHTTIPSEVDNLLDGSNRHYYVEIDNYCDNTNGADYCVDQISFYTSSAKVRAKLTSDICDDGNGVRVKLFAEAGSLLKQLGSGTSKTIFYTILEKSDDSNHTIQAGDVVAGTGYYTNADGTPNDDYGSVTVDLTYDLSSVPNDGSLHGGTKSGTGFYKDTDGTVYFQIVEDYFDLKPGKKYFVSFYNFNYSSVSELTYWGGPYDGKICSVYSNDILPNKLYMDLMEGSETSDGIIKLGCGAAEIEKTFKMKVMFPTMEGTYNEYTDIKFDYFIGSKADFKLIKEGDLYLSDALDKFRDNFTEAYTTSTDLPAASGAFTDAMRTLIATYMNKGEDEGKLVLSAASTFTYKFSGSGEKKFAALPINRDTPDGEICSPIEMVFNIDPTGGGPQLELGFDDVSTYSEAGNKRVIRVGLEQLKMMKEDGYILHIPVSKYQDKNQGTSKKLYFPTNSYLTLSAVNNTLAPADQLPQTSDPTISEDNNAIGKKFAKIVGLTATERPYVNKTRMYLPLDLSECEIDFHEGYSYEVATSFLDEDDDGASNPCIGDLFMIIKVVPEFVTWNAQQIEGEYYSANWYNDANWNRSTRAELYKGAVTDAATDDNHASAGHPNGYKDDLEMDSRFVNNPGMVPMKFTYVMIPTGNHAPSLINEPKIVVEGSKGSKRQGGGFLDTSRTKLLTDRSPNGPGLSSSPTENIYYDLLVRYGTHEEGGVGCFGHRYMKDDGTWDDQTESPELPNAKVFDVEKYYGNVCKEIYFKPESEILRQHRLTYEKAWVEKELDANKWYLVSAPMKDTYAGDMYVPYSATAADNGRQLTEAYQPIMFDQTKGYSRTKYPIYQRSWGQNNGSVYVKTDDVRANRYSANLDFTTVSSVAAEWGHTYNDVQVPYNTLSGFSIRAHRKDQTAKTLIRLPKADTSYEYYDWTDTASDPAAGTSVKTVSKTKMNRFVTDDHVNDGELTVNISDLQQVGDYVLVGNPYMCTLDMAKFFEVNTSLENGYWTYEASVASSEIASPITGGYIKPLQAFFVKKGSATTITFTRQMQIDGNFPAVTNSSTSPARVLETLSLSASNCFGSSKASVRVDTMTSADYVSGEDVETLFDSNLSDVPMVFTVAGSQAVSIDVRPSVDFVSFGVACGGSEAPVDCQLSMADSSPLYMFDAVTGDLTEVYDGLTVSIQPNDYGRYFLTTSDNVTGITNPETAGIVVSVRGKTVTVRSNAMLTSVRVMTVGGETIQSVQPQSTETSLALQQGGVYIVEAQTATTRKTMKIVVSQ